MRPVRVLLALAGAVGAAHVALYLTEHEPRPLLLTPLVISLCLLAWLLHHLLDTTAPLPAWSPPQRVPRSARGEDPRFLRLVQTLENNRVARRPDDRVQAQVAELAAARLALRHDVHLASDPRARDLLDPALLRFLEEPARRVRLSELDEHLERIERL